MVCTQEIPTGVTSELEMSTYLRVTRRQAGVLFRRIFLFFRKGSWEAIQLCMSPGLQTREVDLQKCTTAPGREGSRLTFPPGIAFILAYAPGRKWFSLGNHTTRRIHFACPPRLSPSLLACVLVEAGQWVQHDTHSHKNVSSHFQKLRGREWETKGLAVKTSETQGCVLWLQGTDPARALLGQNSRT